MLHSFLSLNHSTFKCQAVKMKIFVFMFLIISFARSEISERKCIESRYQNKNLGSTVESEFCEKIFQNFTREFTNDIMEQLTNEDNQTCILQAFDHYKIPGLYLRGLIKHLYHNRPDNDVYEDDVDESKEALLKAVKVLCTADKKYGSDFDSHFNNSHNQNNSSGDSHSELCIKKYFYDKKIINPAAYNINPLSINVTNCGEILKELEESFQIPADDDEKINTFFGLSAVNAQRCTKEKFAEAKVLQNIYALEIVEKLILTKQQIEEQRAKYIKLMTSSVKFLLDCIKEI